MALTHQFARVTPEYLEECRTSARDSVEGAPGWHPPPDDVLDTGWALWGLIRFCRTAGGAPDMAALLDRAVSGDPGGNIAFLDHEDVYDGVGDPPRLLTPAAVADIAVALDHMDLEAVLTDLPASTEEAAVACGFGEFNGAVRTHLTEHFTATREFYRGALLRGQCVVVWVD